MSAERAGVRVRPGRSTDGIEVPLSSGQERQLVYVSGIARLENDPDEMKNLAGDPDYAEQAEALTLLMERWRERLGDQQPLRRTV